MLLDSGAQQPGEPSVSVVSPALFFVLFGSRSVWLSFSSDYVPLCLLYSLYTFDLRAGLNVVFALHDLPARMSLSSNFRVRLV